MMKFCILHIQEFHPKGTLFFFFPKGTLDEHEELCTKDFPCGPVAKTAHSQGRGPGLIPGQGARSHMLQQKLKAHMLQLRLGTAKSFFFFLKRHVQALLITARY